MAFKKTQFRGLVNSSMNKYAPDSLKLAKEFVIATWGGRVPEPLLEEWTELWWRREHGSVRSAPKVKVTRKREITLSELKLADEFYALLRKLNLRTEDLRTLIECVQKLGGLEFAITVVEELLNLRTRPRSVEPSLFDGRLEDSSVE